MAFTLSNTASCRMAPMRICTGGNSGRNTPSKAIRFHSSTTSSGAPCAYAGPIFATIRVNAINLVNFLVIVITQLLSEHSEQNACCNSRGSNGRAQGAEKGFRLLDGGIVGGTVDDCQAPAMLLARGLRHRQRGRAIVPPPDERGRCTNALKRRTGHRRDSKLLHPGHELGGASLHARQVVRPDPLPSLAKAPLHSFEVEHTLAP